MATYSGGIQVDEAATLLRSHVISCRRAVPRM